MQNTQDFNGERQTIDNAVGQHLSNKTNEDVRVFYINNAPNISLFPSNLENVFKELTLIWISSSKLSKITKDDLRPFTNLNYLYLSRNIIKSLTADTFIYNPKLEEIWLDFNQIEYIEPMTFSNLNKLIYLGLYKNGCSCISEAQGRSNVEKLVSKINNDECYLKKYDLTEITVEINERIENLMKDNEEMQASIKMLNNLENTVAAFGNNTQSQIDDLKNHNNDLKSQIGDLKEQNKQQMENLTTKIERIEKNINVLVKKLISNDEQEEK